MKSLNKVFLLGNIGSHPELLVAKNGRPYTCLNLATHRSWRDPQEKLQERTDWHSVMVWGNQAKACVSSLQKGALVFVEGQISTYQRSDENGENSQNAVNITAYRVNFFSRAGQRSETKSEELLESEAV